MGSDVHATRIVAAVRRRHRGTLADEIELIRPRSGPRDGRDLRSSRSLDHSVMLSAQRGQQLAWARRSVPGCGTSALRARPSALTLTAREQ